MSREFIFFLLALSLAGCSTLRRFTPVGSHTLEARRLTQEAEAAIHEESWDEAEGMLAAAIDKSPEDNHARSVLAEVLWQRGAQRAAIEQKTRAIELSGLQDPLALTELGQMEFSVGAHEQALAHANQALAIDSSHADAWTLRGFVLRAQGELEEALGSFFRSLSVRSGDPRTRLEIARIYYETRQPQRAMAILGAAPHEATNECPFYSDVCYLRGLILDELGRSSDAADAFKLARDNGCQESDLLLRLADSQLDAGERLQARATLVDAEKSVNQSLQIAVRDLKAKIEASWH